jgi:hypothetical protein
VISIESLRKEWFLKLYKTNDGSDFRGSHSALKSNISVVKIDQRKKCCIMFSITLIFTWMETNTASHLFSNEFISGTGWKNLTVVVEVVVSL